MIFHDICCRYSYRLHYRLINIGVRTHFQLHVRHCISQSENRTTITAVTCRSSLVFHEAHTGAWLILSDVPLSFSCLEHAYVFKVCSTFTAGLAPPRSCSPAALCVCAARCVVIGSIDLKLSSVRHSQCVVYFRQFSRFFEGTKTNVIAATR